MVVRPPLEKWSRPELEDRYHEVLDRLTRTQKENAENEKQITQMNSKFRRSIEQRKAKGDDSVDPVLYFETIKRNEVLSMKVRSLKHQLLTYTHPTVRSSTATAMTGRTTQRSTTFRPSTRRPLPPASRQEDHHSTVLSPTPTVSQIDRSHRPSSVRVTEGSVHEKATIIKLNRLIRGHLETIDEQRIDIQKLNEQLSSLRAQLDTARASLEERSKARQSQDGVEEEHKRVERSRIELLSEELQQIRGENNVLKSANERLVRQSLEAELDTVSASEVIDLKQALAKSEELLREIERSARESEKKLKEDIKRVKSERNSLEKQLRHAKEFAKSHDAPTIASPPIDRKRRDRTSEEEDEDNQKKDRKKKKAKKEDKKHTDDLFKKLFADVSGLIKSSQVPDGEETFSAAQLSHSKWQQLYSELYDEVEKLRNMLLIQHDITQKQSAEIALLKDERSRLLIECERKIDQWKEKAAERQKKIILLEQQIRDIAYSGQKEIPIEVGKDQIGTSPSSSELTVTIKTIRLMPDDHGKVPQHPFFLSLEFFDFELQTTEMTSLSSTAPSALTHLNYTCIYDVIVSQLFVHYLQTSGMQIELYRPSGASYSLIGAGALSLSRLFSRTSKERVGGEIRLLDLSSGRPIANIEYEASVTRELNEAIAAYRLQEAAQKRLPLEIPPNEDEFNLLRISIQRCHEIDRLPRVPSSPVCIVYEFAGFSPFLTKFIAARGGTTNFSNTRTWHLPATAQFDAMLAGTEISFYLMEAVEEGKGKKKEEKENEGVLAMLTLPLRPLSEGKQIIGAFRMQTPDGRELPLTTLDISLAWENGYRKGKKEAKTEEPPAVTSTVATQPVVHPIPASPVAQTPSPPQAPSPDKAPSISSAPNSPQLSIQSGISIPQPTAPPIEDSSPPRDSPPMPPLARERSIELIRSPPHSVASTSSQDTVVNDRPPPDVVTIAEVHDEPPPRVKSISPESEEIKSPAFERSLSPAPSVSDDERKEMKTPLPDSPRVSPDDTPRPEVEEVSPPHSVDPLPPLPSLPPLPGLPPIAKPRMSLTGREQLNVEEFSFNEGREEKKYRQPIVLKFGEPMHTSVPPSEDSSFASSPPPNRPRKSIPRLDAIAGKGLLKERRRAEDIIEEGTEEVSVTIRIDKFYCAPGSMLLSRQFQEGRIMVDWVFLDLPHEDCRTQPFKPPRMSTLPAHVDFSKEYTLSGKRLALLRQWMKLGVRIEFTIISDAGDDSEEIATAQLDLHRLPKQSAKLINFFSRDDTEVADVEVIIEHNLETSDDERGEEDDDYDDEEEIDVDIGKLLG